MSPGHATRKAPTPRVGKTASGRRSFRAATSGEPTSRHVTTTGQNHVPQVDTFHFHGQWRKKGRLARVQPVDDPHRGSGRLTPSTPQGVKSARKGQQGFCLPFKTFFGRIVCDITVDVADVAAIFNMKPRNALCGPCRGVGWN